ncbi:ThuA domain-containing protein [Actinomycetospora lutea]|uniref:ThuA domain-containing protein n=1 Tax=Actinomycetospora lutea TaxID=663604 RepID=UPI0023664C89|nr:ThuA domain-containing protein [Actinomycetospora lutea]MDD7937447.1 ThuA domain-containing protein [Actinomycetospora lutea]
MTHDFPATTSCLTALLAPLGVASEVHEGVDGVDEAFLALPGADLLVVNALRWTMTGPGVPDRYREQADAEGASPSAAARAAFADHLAGGGGVLAVHTAALCFDDWPEWGAALGARWVWGRSQHPPLGPEIDVSVVGDGDLVGGVEGFSLVDEVYGDMDLAGDLDPQLAAPQPVTDGRTMPLLWAREHGGGRVVYDALGHHPPSYAVPEHAEIVTRAARWALGGRGG